MYGAASGCIFHNRRCIDSWVHHVPDIRAHQIFKYNSPDVCGYAFRTCSENCQLTTLAKASGFTVLVFSLSMIFVGISMHLFFGWTYLEGLLLGAVLGGTSFAIVTSIISKLTMNEDSKVILTLESVLTDPLCIIIAIALIEVISLGTVNLRNTAVSLTSAFSIAIVIAVIFGIFWIGIINKLPPSPMLTSLQAL